VGNLNYLKVVGVLNQSKTYQDRMIKVVINRKYLPNETLGAMFVLMDYELLFSCRTLELPWLDNQHKISCVPARVYDVIKYDSPNKGIVFLLQNVPDRDSIEIHSGNFTKDTLGCILVGSGFEDIDGNGTMDVIESRKTLDKLMSILPDEFKLYIL
jgi:hypothetical protein